jgi:hypothetical protein
MEPIQQIRQWFVALSSTVALGIVSRPSSPYLKLVMETSTFQNILSFQQVNKKTFNVESNSGTHVFSQFYRYLLVRFMFMSYDHVLILKGIREIWFNINVL